MIKILFLLLTVQSFASTNTICGKDDERQLSFVKEVGRAVKPLAEVGCTITLIGKSCAVSAGHCFNDLKIVQFNMFLNADNILVANPEDTYLVDEQSYVGENKGHGKDWSVFRLQKNLQTNFYAGEVQGFLRTDMKSYVASGSAVTVTGYGWKSRNQTKNSPQQTHTSFLMAVDRGILYYDVDTMGGNSGSAIINDQGAIIGIHTHGYCSEEGGANQGTLLVGQKKFKSAINNCLAWEKDHLK